MMRVKSVYYERLETIPGRMANETFGVNVEITDWVAASTAKDAAIEFVDNWHSERGCLHRDQQALIAARNDLLHLEQRKMRLIAEIDNLSQRAKELRDELNDFADCELPF